MTDTWSRVTSGLSLVSRVMPRLAPFPADQGLMRLTHHNRLILAAIWAALLLARTANAQEQAPRDPDLIALLTPSMKSPRQEHPTVVRGSAHLFVSSDCSLIFGPCPAVGALGITLSRSLIDRVALEGSLAYGFGSDAPSALYAGPSLRTALFAADLYALTLTGGLTLPVNGRGLPYAYGEVGCDVRTRSGFDLVVGIGPGFALKDDTHTKIDYYGWFRGDAQPFRSGDVAYFFTLEMGWAF